MRGKVYAHRSARVRCGITPAYAGKSSYTSDRAAVSRDHPRVCGEKYWRHSCPQMRSGSPPRMRGKVQPDADGCRPPRITPAYAGKRMLYARAVRRDRDHPRVCGEKIVLVIVFCSLMGSPPRMRGKVMRKEILRIIHGITPAYAGKREGPKNAQSKVGDHPRVCGEKCIPLTRGHGRQGSPPRMRGKD